MSMEFGVAKGHVLSNDAMELLTNRVILGEENYVEIVVRAIARFEGLDQNKWFDWSSTLDVVAGDPHKLFPWLSCHLKINGFVPFAKFAFTPEKWSSYEDNTKELLQVQFVDSIVVLFGLTSNSSANEALALEARAKDAIVFFLLKDANLDLEIEANHVSNNLDEKGKATVLMALATVRSQIEKAGISSSKEVKAGASSRKKSIDDR